jgi:hypothetical protein
MMKTTHFSDIRQECQDASTAKCPALQLGKVMRQTTTVVFKLLAHSYGLILEIMIGYKL